MADREPAEKLIEKADLWLEGKAMGLITRVLVRQLRDALEQSEREKADDDSGVLQTRYAEWLEDRKRRGDFS